MDIKNFLKSIWNGNTEDVEQAVVSITGTELMANKPIIDSVPVTSLSPAVALAAVVFAVPAVVHLVTSKFKD
ncbi:hypothetical protein NRE35_004213 [Salmonella enterica]|nr:hypothetical protein [Salmonella enterica]